MHMKPTVHDADSFIVIAFVWTDPINQYHQLRCSIFSHQWSWFTRIILAGKETGVSSDMTTGCFPDPDAMDPPRLYVMKLPCFERRNAPMMIAHCCPVTSLHQLPLYSVTSPALLFGTLRNPGVFSNPRALVLNTPNVHFIVTPWPLIRPARFLWHNDWKAV